MVKFLGDTEKQLENYKTLQRFMTLSRFLWIMDFDEIAFTKPETWADPYESYFTKAMYFINKKRVALPAKANAYCLCFSGTYNSEAYWKVYAPKGDGIRLAVDTKKFISELNTLKDVQIFAGKVRYHSSQEFSKLEIDREALKQEIINGKVGPAQLNLLLKKRKAFSYEDEFRFIILPKSKNRKDNFYVAPIEMKKVIAGCHLDPRMEPNMIFMAQDFIARKYKIKAGKSVLYRPVKTKSFHL